MVIAQETIEAQIGSIGMVTPVGLNSASSCAAFRAGISRLQELPVNHPLAEPVIGAYIPTRVPFGLSRLIRILAPAIRECIQGLTKNEISQIPLLLGVAEPDRPGRPANIESELIRGVSRRLRVSFDPANSRVISEGRASVLTALHTARSLLSAGAKRCLVAGVDCLLDSQCLAWLFRNERLKLHANPDGLLPGEGAAAVELLPADAPVHGPKVNLTGLGYGREKATVLIDEPNLADGLAEAVKGALTEAGLNLVQVDYRQSDVNGEQYYFKETALAQMKVLREHHKNGFPIWHCADSIGDTGAASGALMLGISVTAFRKGYAPGTTVICQSSSDFGARAAAILRRIN